MASPPPDPPEHDLAAIDWAALRASARRGLRARMNGFNHDDIEDAASDVVDRFLRFVRRHGPPHTPEGLLFELVRRVAANQIVNRQRDRALAQAALSSGVLTDHAEMDEDEILVEYANIVFHVQAYFRLKKAECATLADAKSRGESLKAHAAERGLSYEKIRQDWSRCVKLIHDAMRAKRLRLPWPTPPRRRQPDA